ncbi:uncharacterized protein UV8b_03243 [Ustilaginoidea virens]|uniref:Uncharacterized protein n=1 Tax=Ustilaginoidea virens TaxID=1159556 RepID=A0A8E5HPC0_USTVR|nr:uncharacterized protein UV8b_03243 [Ustilaginoidea virens]QUC19002.1 hypothetical protein UV8b_03243 [Ustilaginoidea virens]
MSPSATGEAQRFNVKSRVMLPAQMIKLRADPRKATLYLIKLFGGAYYLKSHTPAHNYNFNNNKVRGACFTASSKGKLWLLSALFTIRAFELMEIGHSVSIASMTHTGFLETRNG